MKILGVWFGDNVEDENWQPKIEKLKKCMGLWSSRDLSLCGRVLVVNVVGAAKLFYLARVEIAVHIFCLLVDVYIILIKRL
jgi:hypothetical protein